MTNNLQYKLFDDSQYTRYTDAKVQKRDGRLVNFDMHKISNAIKKAIIAQTGSFDEYGSYVLDKQCFILIVLLIMTCKWELQLSL